MYGWSIPYPRSLSLENTLVYLIQSKENPEKLSNKNQKERDQQKDEKHDGLFALTVEYPIIYWWKESRKS